MIFWEREDVFSIFFEKKKLFKWALLKYHLHGNTHKKFLLWCLLTHGSCHPDEDQEHFRHPPYPIAVSTPSPPQATHDLLSATRGLCCGNIPHVFFCGWLLTLSIMLICAIVGHGLVFLLLFFSIANWSSIVWIHFHLFTYASDRWWPWPPQFPLLWHGRKVYRLGWIVVRFKWVPMSDEKDTWHLASATWSVAVIDSNNNGFSYLLLCNKVTPRT